MIYVVEDDKAIRNLVLYALKEKNYQVRGFEDGLNVVESLKNENVDLLILDIMLPEKDGIEILKEVREFSDIPIIMLTAKNDEYDKVLGLESGADDYITKPFSILELISRIKAVLRRSEKKDSEHLSYKNIRVNIKKRTAKIDGEKIDLTYKEFEMLLLFLSNIGNVITREDFLLKIWGYDYEGETRTVDVHIASLRNKLKSAGLHIKTVRNLGYKLGEI
ncbi:DNA-binding response regulator [Anaerococcus sp. HMSC075B03]|uniref:Transcriptional regulatory protein YycF n=2 Tax=Anaerococcus TaxID=165779 RepID=A0A6N2RLW8_9FIRM|nr:MULTISPECIES: response regulator transcription factor [Anaerococcus]MBS4888852.1 response regulator transcription factor [Anaerococcus vaginalis]MDU0946274.1 response regulator transcription factor [Anaerococcus vaginalis]MDU1030172.1 response regulator transcription factor [Anaerococcus vaginalis]MDU4378653.1 response regulator transcription factor [Anaerococcus vaginalis]MDU5372788.1 response regulator transcription factor [Anaerococcus vaginalis]